MSQKKTIKKKVVKRKSEKVCDTEGFSFFLTSDVCIRVFRGEHGRIMLDISGTENKKENLTWKEQAKKRIRDENK